MNKNFLPHSKSSCHLTARELKLWKRKAQAHMHTGKVYCFEGNHGYQFLTRKTNKQLFNYLDRCGFFEFHCTNTQRQICSLHQIVLYLHKGWELFLFGYTCPCGTYEIHHLDHDPRNCEPENLVYVTPQENQILASITKMSYHSNAQIPLIGAFNAKNKLTNFANILKLTFERTYSKLGFQVPDVSLASWLFSLPANLGKQLYKYWVKVPATVADFYNTIYP
jgi:hypothetical protein